MNFAVIDGENVLNTIVAESKEIAEEITGKTCIEYGLADSAESGGTYVSGVFIPRKPYPSWILNQFNQWEAPVPHPTIDSDDLITFIWDESSISWIEKL
jgi:hypothetical protein